MSEQHPVIPAIAASTGCIVLLTWAHYRDSANFDAAVFGVSVGTALYLAAKVWKPKWILRILYGEQPPIQEGK